jgi:hypothetical protein
MLQCPRCKSNRVHRSRSRNRWERWRRQITGKATFRCGQCRWRGWSVDDGATLVTSPDAASIPDAPNLQGSGLERSDRPELQLEALDTLE